MKFLLANDDRLGLLLSQGSPWRYAWTPTWSGSIWIPLFFAVACIAIVLLGYLQETRGISLTRRVILAGLRSLAILLTTWMLLGWVWSPYAEEPADLVFLIDSSQSMLTEDVLAADKKKPLSRAAAAKSLLLSTEEGALLEAAARSYRLRAGHFGKETQWLPSDVVRLRQEMEALSPSGQETRIGAAIADALQFQRGRGTAAIVIWSDGVQTSGSTLSSAASSAKAAGVPLFVVGLGDDRPTRDVSISQLVYSPTVFLGDLLYVEGTVTFEGFGNVSPQVMLKDAASGEILASEPVANASAASTRIRLPIRPLRLGEWKFRVEVEPLPGDANPENNIATGSIRVQEETVRVLLVDRQPRYDVRYLVDTLSRARKRGEKSEPAFEIRTFLQEGDLGLSAQDPSALNGLPSLEEMARFDVIVLGDIDPQLLGVSAQKDLLAAITRRGAGLLLLPSAQVGFEPWLDQPLEVLLPARVGETSTFISQDGAPPARLTHLGKQTPFCVLGDKAVQSANAWRSLPAFPGMVTTKRLRSDLRVLVEAADSRMENGRAAPVVTSHFVGAAKVLSHWTDEWWRWASPPTRQYYDQYWMQAIRSLCPQRMPAGERPLELWTEAPRYLEGQAVKMHLHFRDHSLSPGGEGGAVVALRSEGTSREWILSRDEVRGDLFHGTMADLPPGVYSAKVIRPAVVTAAADECRFEIAARADESTRIRPDFGSLQLLAEQSGGKFYTRASASRLLRDLPRGSTVRTTPLPPRSAWNLPIWAAMLVGLLGFEWFLRRTSGLL